MLNSRLIFTSPAFDKKKCTLRFGDPVSLGREKKCDKREGSEWILKMGDAAAVILVVG